MEDHMVHTINMLEKLPFPKHLRRVPEFAGGHHERMDGNGYPRGLTKEQMSIPARIMGIADVFEALTAPERSYKKPMPLSQSLTIMGRMVENNHLDADLFRLFVDKQVYLNYAQEFLQPEQIDTVDLTQLPGYSAR
ncbi:phosphohydrolase, partial [Pseudidiomarina aestuarii]